MALKLNERYPGRFENPSGSYPQGSFKNRSAPGVMDGSYLEKDWANDKEGFFQSLLAEAGITANGNVDTVGASQYYSALIQVITRAVSQSTGTIGVFAANAVPDGWLKANGAAVNRTTYAALFAAIGTTYGAGNGSTTFSVPDLRGEFVRGFDDGRGVDIGRAFGSRQLGTLVAADDPVADGVGGIHLTTGSDVGDMGADRIDSGSTLYPRATPGQASGINNWTVTHGVARPRNVALLYCIKY